MHQLAIRFLHAAGRVCSSNYGDRLAMRRLKEKILLKRVICVRWTATYQACVRKPS